MNTALLVLTLLSADDAPADVDASAPTIEAQAPETIDVPVAPEENPDAWPGEGRRVHFGLGTRVHGGVRASVGGPVMNLLSDFGAFMSIRVFGHHEWRVGIGLLLGYGDIFAGESNVSFRYHLNPRLSVGLGFVEYIAFSSVRGGIEVPVALRFGPTRRHELTFAVRATAGTYNGSVSFVWYDFNHASFAYAVDAIVGYSAIF